MLEKGSAQRDWQQASTRTTRFESNSHEQTKVSEGYEQSISPSKQFQRRPSKANCRRSKLKSINEPKLIESTPLPPNNPHMKGLVTVPSLKNFRQFATEDQRQPSPTRLMHKSKKHLPQTKPEKNSSRQIEVYFQSSKSCTELLEEITALKQFNSILEQHNAALVDKNNRYKQENLLLLNKIQNLNSNLKNLKEDNEELNQLYLKEKQCFREQKEINFYLEDIVLDLNEKIEQFHQNQKNSSDTTQICDKSTIEELQREIEVLKQENYEMKQQIRYSNIENDMMKRTTQYNLQQEQKLNKYLDNQNRKLLARLDSLSKVKKNLESPQLKKLNRILESSLSFSFD